MIKRKSMVTVNNPDVHVRVEETLDRLGLVGMKSVLYELINQHLETKESVIHLLDRLLQEQERYEENRRIQRFEREAHFPPSPKTLMQFNFSLNPNLDERKIRYLASCKFIEDGENICFLGQTGVGKTHLAVAIGKEAINNNFKVLFIKIGDLIKKVEKDISENNQTKRLQYFLRPQLLILDELGYHEGSAGFDQFLFDLIYQRHEQRKSVIITSNKSFGDWVKQFGDVDKGAAAVERATRYSHIFVIEGESYRIRERREVFDKETEKKMNEYFAVEDYLKEKK